MLNLIKKELTANVRYTLFGLVIFGLYMFVFAANGEGLFMLCLVFCFYMISTTNLLLDERYKIDSLFTTLPVRRKDMVASKYLLIAVVFVICFILYTILSAAAWALGYNKIPLLNLHSAMLGLFAVSLYNGIMLPLCYKFGAQAMRYVALVLFFIIFFISSLFGQFDIRQFEGFFANIGDTGVGLLLFAGALLINGISYSIAYPIYAKKDL